MLNKVCAKCGQKVLGECLDPKCQQYFQKKLEQRIQQKELPDYQKEIELLNRYGSNLNLEDYSKLKKIKTEVEKWDKKLNSSPVKPQVEQLLKDIEELENKFPKRIKLKSKGKSKDCFHKNIHWLGFFQDEETEEPYCLDCGEDENPKFTKAFQRWYCKKVEEWLNTNNLKYYRFTVNFLKKNNFYDKWQSLERGKEFENIKDEFFIFQEMNKLIEEYLLEFAEEQENNASKVNNNKSNFNKHRERERESKITERYH